MNKELKNYLFTMGIEKLMESKAGDKLEQAMGIFKNVEKHVDALSEKQGEEFCTSMKSATVMIFSILLKIRNGKQLSAFTSEDWKDITKDVSENTILMDDQQYVKSVFFMYENYIRYWASYVETFAPEKTVSIIYGLADELAAKRELLDAGQMDEVAFIEDCLWISLESMVKLLSCMASLVAPEEFAAYAQAAAAYAFEYGRFMLYHREQELITQFIESQYKLDAELSAKYEAFLKDLQQQSEQFCMLIDNAFAPDFRQAFLNSIILAKSAGVDESEVLTTVEAIDDFFMES